VYWGAVMVRSDENGLARGAVLKAGYPDNVSAVQLNRACCSSMEAIRIASMEIRLGESQAVVAGGGESMSNVSYSIKNARWGLGWRHQELSDGIWDGLFDHLKPAFKKDGTVTAGNASGLNAGASAVLVMSKAMADQYQMKSQWRVVGSAAVGVDPKVMGIGPIDAVRKLFKQTGYTIDDIELIEINEAFAAPSVAVEKELGLNRDIVNVNGSGIALGHPIGDTGCRITVSLIHEMEKRGLSRGLASLCGGGGHGQAIIIERVE